MKIFVKIPNGNTITLEVQEIETILDVKSMVKQQLGILSNHQMKLFFAGQELEHRATVVDYEPIWPSIADFNIQDGSTLDLKLLLKISFIVMSYELGMRWEGYSFTWNFDSLEMVRYLKSVIHQQTNISPEFQRVSFEKMRLKDDKTLASYDLWRVSNEHPVEIYDYKELCRSFSRLNAAYNPENVGNPEAEEDNPEDED